MAMLEGLSELIITKYTKTQHGLCLSSVWLYVTLSLLEPCRVAFSYLHRVQY